MTRLKRFTGSATATGKKNSESGGENRWFRLPIATSGQTQIDSLLDLYWGGPERRITGITIRIIAVNALALLVLMLGILYLGQYQSGIIKTRLGTFQTDLGLISAAFSEGATVDGGDSLSLKTVRDMTKKFGEISNQRIRVFSANGSIIADSVALSGRTGNSVHTKTRFESTQILREFMRLLLSFLPERHILPVHPSPESRLAAEHPDAADALTGHLSLSAWRGNGSKVLLSAAAPIGNPDFPVGAVLLTRESHDIEEELAQVWLDILKIFGITLILTVTMSIYLSGVIARPLKRLARATEAVRRGQASAQDIPDLSNRHDEIGELSLALRQMTQALWERMDSIERFAADVSHELKNPLTSLRSALETLEIVKTETDRRKLLDIIRHDLRRLDRLITDIAGASRLEAELSREKPGNIDLEILISRLMSAFANPLERKNGLETEERHRVATGMKSIILKKTAEDSETLSTWGLEGRLAQVFQNLLSNALSFSPEGGTVTITMRPAGSRAIAITVEDEGPGIPETRLETIFERFYSERPEHEAYGHHSGLGLSICRQIVTAHGGRIFAENIRNQRGEVKGARFTVILNKAPQGD